MDIPYRITDEKILSNEWGKLRSVSFETKDENGDWHAQEGELYDVGNGVAVLLYNKERHTILLVRQFRFATVYNGHPSGMLIEVCAGKVDDLSPEQTIRKEILEETGYSISELHFVMKLYVSPGSFTELLHLYAAPYTDGQKVEQGGGLPEEGERIETIEIPFQEALAMVSKGEIMDAKTIILLQYAAIAKLL